MMSQNNAARPEALPNLSLVEEISNFVKRYRRVILQALCVSAFTTAAFLCYYYRPTDLCFGKDGKQGTCMDIFKCPFAFNEIKEGKKPVFCDKLKTKVCCVEDNIPTLDAKDLRHHVEETTTTTDDFGTPSVRRFPTTDDRCEPLTNYSMAAPYRISFQKCLQYQELLVFPCEVESMSFMLEEEKMARLNYCNWKPETMIDDNAKTDAYYGEFPHMALLGYDSPDNEWQCSGSIISDRFILTAAHCTFSRNGGNVTKVRIGFLKISQTIQRDELYYVSEVHKHPHYKSPNMYHDIALLKTNSTMTLNRYRVPACLDDGSLFKRDTVTVTGWGQAIANKYPLQKIKVDKFTADECEKLYSSNKARLMPRGYDSRTQICYGDRSTGKRSTRIFNALSRATAEVQLR
ncbi:coagulation factor X-like isoform X3 [Vanessa atalanta]|uniref:coagulation factor X-like isoform X3 n=1 Tax=Vanessa atalanta TaxID=42275 RepID=UPI001FCDC0DA|nr:coagulation factor X-like isoform X3 [Vanessa atalanta]